jgi:hypothetical protein
MKKLANPLDPGDISCSETSQASLKAGALCTYLYLALGLHIFQAIPLMPLAI